MAASSRDDHSVIIFLFLLVVDLITPLCASNLEVQDVVEAGEDIQDKEQDVQAQVNCPLVLSNDGRTVGLQDTFGTSLSSTAVASTNAKEADNEAKENIDRGHVVEPDHVDFDKCREKVERCTVPLNHVPDSGKSNRCRESVSICSILARARSTDVSEDVDCIDGHNQVERVDEES